MSTLFDLLLESTRERQNVLEQILNNNGEITPELEQQLESFNPDLPAKVDRYYYFLEDLEAQSKLYRENAKRFAEAARSIDSFMNRLEDRVKIVMQTFNKTELNGDLIRYKLSKCQKKLIIDPKLLESKYFIRVTELVPDNENIKKALESGETIKGARLEGGFTLRSYLNKKS